MTDSFIYDHLSKIPLRSLVRSATPRNSWRKIVRTHQPWSNLYFRIYVKHAFDEVALYPLHNIENYLFLKNFEMIALFVTACRYC